MNTSVVYPPRAARALGFLNSRSNDIEVYVEDQSTPNLWVNLLEKYLPNGIQLTSVNVLGSRHSVITACRADQQDDGRKRLYIIDGDFDVLQGKRKPRLKHLYMLRSYSVENYLLDEVAIVSAVRILDPQVDQQTALQRLDFSGWFARNRDALTYLFVCYAVSFVLNREQETVGFSVHRLLRPGDPNFDLCEARVATRVIGLYRSIRNHNSKEETRRVFDRIRSNAAKVGVERFVSGKDYIFPVLYQSVVSRFRATTRTGSFKTLVAQCMVSIRDPYFLRSLHRIFR